MSQSQNSLITAMLLLALAQGMELIAQPTATDFSYFPMHIGNIWVYEVGVTPTFEPRTILRYERVEITHDTVLANGKRYVVMNGEIPMLSWVSLAGPSLVRIDSLSGSVFKWRPSRRSACADTAEVEITRIVVDSTSHVLLCGNAVGSWYVFKSTQKEQAGKIDTMRYIRTWGSFHRIERYSEGIGLSSTKFGYNHTYDGIHGSLDYQLVYARIDGVQYFPVTFRSFHADLLPGNRVHLRWSTEQEMQNAGFTVQRRVGR
ncbi:MAG: hypothetical protein KFH87_02800, partial [Bacteroidetes bacterium]|nr:hypothetical protein [Bacteroidota bacterium]